MVRITFLTLLLLAPALLPVSAQSTGSRLSKPDNDPATYQFERGQKAEARADGYMAELTTATGSKAESLKKKAQKQYGNAAKLYMRALRINEYHGGARASLGPALLKSADPAEAVEILTEAVEDYPKLSALKDSLAEAQAAANGQTTD